jgi:hypothetical protein
MVPSRGVEPRRATFGASPPNPWARAWCSLSSDPDCVPATRPRHENWLRTLRTRASSPNTFICVSASGRSRTHFPRFVVAVPIHRQRQSQWHRVRVSSPSNQIERLVTSPEVERGMDAPGRIRTCALAFRRRSAVRQREHGGEAPPRREEPNSLRPRRGGACRPLNGDVLRGCTEP